MSSPPAVRPMVLRRFVEPFSGTGWLFELKHDGFRALAPCVDGDCRLVSRKNYTYKRLEPVCESIAEALADRDCILDGEIVCLAEDGRALFKNLMCRRGEPFFYAFDLLWQLLASATHQRRRYEAISMGFSVPLVMMSGSLFADQIFFYLAALQPGILTPAAMHQDRHWDGYITDLCIYGGFAFFGGNQYDFSPT